MNLSSLYYWIKKCLYPFYSFFGIKSVRKRQRQKHFRRKSLFVFERAIKALESHKIEFWLAFGTLLGAFREKNFINHDLDIDLAVAASVDPKKIELAFLKNGFKRYRTFECIEKNTKYISEQRFILDHIKIDVFFFHKEKTHVWTHVFYQVEKDKLWKIKKNYFPVHSLITTRFLGFEIKIPDQTETYLAYHYGENFMTPNADWDYFNSPIHSIESPQTKVIVS